VTRAKALGQVEPDFNTPDSTGNGSSNSTGSFTSDPGGGRPPGARINPYSAPVDNAGKSLMIKVLPNGRAKIDLDPADKEALAKSRFTMPWERPAPSARGLEPTVAGEAHVEAQKCMDLAFAAVDLESRNMWLDAAREIRKAAGI
jgi:hypothetical protein